MKAVKEIGFKEILRFVFYTFAETLFNIGTYPPMRKLILQLLGSKIGEDSVIMHVKFFNWHKKGPVGFSAGRDCFIGDECLIDLHNSLILEDQVTIAPKVTVLTHINVGYKDHPLQKEFPKKSATVIIKKGSVIGASSTILPGITIGTNSFVAAGSVVTQDVPEKSLVAGVPAKIIRKIK